MTDALKDEFPDPETELAFLDFLATEWPNWRYHVGSDYWHIRRRSFLAGRPAPQALAATPAVAILSREKSDRLLSECGYEPATPAVGGEPRATAWRDLVERLRNPMWVHSGVPFYGPQLEREENLAAMEEAAAEIERLRAAQPQYLTGCLHPGSCQRLGLCQSMSCNHAGNVIVKRVCVEPREAGIVYPSTERAK